MGDPVVKVAALRVSVTFFDPQTKLLVERDVMTATTHQSLMVSTRNACQAHCKVEGYRLFAIPSFVERDGAERWLVFRYAPSHERVDLVRDWPTRASAEMWMQHNG